MKFHRFQEFAQMTLAADGSAQLGVPLQVTDIELAQQNYSSHSYSLASSALSIVGGAGPEYQKFSIEHKANVRRACDLLIMEIIENIGWGSTATEFSDAETECLSQASAESSHITEWDERVHKTYMEHVQTLRGKMATKAEAFAKNYDLSTAVDPKNLLPLFERRAAAVARCEQMLRNTHWKTYYLHRFDPVTNTCTLFGNQILKDYHLAFWYKSSLSPFRRNENWRMWETTPIRLLSTSAAALACGLRRVAQSVGSTTRPSRIVRYSQEEYNPIEKQIFEGMEIVHGHRVDAIRLGFREILDEYHREGCSMLSNASFSSFYVPTLQQLQGLEESNAASGSQQYALASN
ncbi:hypothetical protein JVU11DRAFT_3708 [Chiua virens]|nr:hypothetical protein JVU11DRAFT_3708 [Chiua virens]